LKRPDLSRSKDQFKKGVSGNTIEMDERFTDANQYSKIMKYKKEADLKDGVEKKHHLEDLEFNNSRNLDVKKEPLEDLVGTKKDKNYFPSKASKRMNGD
jgi:hypothetical protein